MAIVLSIAGDTRLKISERRDKYIAMIDNRVGYSNNHRKTMSFDGQHVIITGGSSGIGKATAKLLAAYGANITIIARTPSKLESAKLEIEAARGDRDRRVEAVVADVAERFQVQQAIATAIDRNGPPDLAIAAAGIAHPGYFQELPIEVFERTMAINYFGTLYTIEAVVPAMMQRRSGRVVMISSGAGLVGIYGYTSYSPTKFALRGLAESLRGELKPFGIGVSIVYPPDTDTPQLATENETKPPETKLITGTAGVWQPEDVAIAIVRGIETGTFAIAPGLEMKLLLKLHSLFSSAIARYCDRQVTRLRK